MLNESFIERNVELYLNKMEEKHLQNNKKIEDLERKLHNAAIRIQRCWKRYLLKIRTRAAIKIQRNFRQFLKRKRQRKQKLLKFKKIFSSYKIYYFLQAKAFPNKAKQNKQKGKILSKPLKYKVSSQIVRNCRQYLVMISALQSELSYLKKYIAYDRKSFHDSWQSYEKKQRDWMWSQIKKKWVRKQGQIWINQHDKEVNAQNYVNRLIEQGYEKYYQKFQHSQSKLQNSKNELLAKMQKISRSYIFSILFV